MSSNSSPESRPRLGLHRADSSRSYHEPKLNVPPIDHARTQSDETSDRSHSPAPEAGKPAVSRTAARIQASEQRLDAQDPDYEPSAEEESLRFKLAVVKRVRKPIARGRGNGKTGTNPCDALLRMIHTCG